eukprot:231653_1
MSKFISGYVDTLRRDNIQLEEIVQKLDPTGDTLQEHSAQRSMQIYIERKKTEAVSGKVASSDLYFKPLQREIQVMSVSRYQCRFVGLINPQVDPMNRKIPSLSWILEVINQTCSQKLTDEQKSAASTVLPLPEFLVEKLAPQLIDQQPEEKPVNSTEADACDEVCMNIYVASLAYCHSNVQVELFKEFLDEKHDPRTLSFYLEARDHISTLQRSHGREIMGPSFVEATMFAEIVANLFPNITETSRFHLVNTLKRAALLEIVHEKNAVLEVHHLLKLVLLSATKIDQKFEEDSVRFFGQLRGAYPGTEMNCMNLRPQFQLVLPAISSEKMNRLLYQLHHHSDSIRPATGSSKGSRPDSRKSETSAGAQVATRLSTFVSVIRAHVTRPTEMRLARFVRDPENISKRQIRLLMTEIDTQWTTFDTGSLATMFQFFDDDEFRHDANIQVRVLRVRDLRSHIVQAVKGKLLAEALYTYMLVGLEIQTLVYETQQGAQRVWSDSQTDRVLRDLKRWEASSSQLLELMFQRAMRGASGPGKVRRGRKQMGQRTSVASDQAPRKSVVRRQSVVQRQTVVRRQSVVQRQSVVRRQSVVSQGEKSESAAKLKMNAKDKWKKAKPLSKFLALTRQPTVSTDPSQRVSVEAKTMEFSF